MDASFVESILVDGESLHKAVTQDLNKLGSKLHLEEIKEACQSPSYLRGADVDCGDIISGDLFAAISTPPFYSFTDGLEEVLSKSTGALIRLLDFTMAVTMTETGLLFFDPHARNKRGMVDGDGGAIILHFTATEDLASHLRGFVLKNGQQKSPLSKIEELTISQRSFELLPVTIISLKVNVQTLKLSYTLYL